MNTLARRASFRPLISALLFGFVFGIGASAQQSPLDAPAFTADPGALLHAAASIPKEKNANVMVLLDEQRDTVDERGRANSTTHTIFRVDTAKGVEQWATVGAKYWPWYQARPTVRARVITPDGAQHNLDPKTLNDAAVRDNSPDMFSDEHAYEGPLPAVMIGAVVEEEIVQDDTAPFFEGVWSSRYYFAYRPEPVLKAKYTLDVPAAMPLRYQVHQLPDLKVQKNEAAGRVIYAFELGRAEAAEPQRLLPPEVSRYPHVSFTTAANWHDLAALYAKRSEPQIRPAEVRPLLNDVHETGRAAIARLLAKVHANARYTGLEFGESSIVPQPPSETLKRKYGDCKDKATLLVSLLRAAGIPANLALLSSGHDHDVEPESPGMTWFNHAIVYVPGEDLFIDATAEYSRVGELPIDDQDRWALVISENTTELKRIPQLPSSTNRTVEKREFFLAEYGPARVVETTEWYGNNEAHYRDSYAGGEGKDFKKSLDEYAQSAYLADAVSKYERGDVADLSRHFFLRLEVPKAKRGNTALNDAVAAIRLIDMVTSQIPEAMRADSKDDDPDAPAKSGSKPRTVDWYLRDLYQAEWQYRVVPPAGFRVRLLPESKTTKFGPAMLTQEYKAAADGAVEASIRFDLVKRRYSPAEVTALRTALKQLGENGNGVLVIHFDLTAQTLLQQGKVREALAELRRLIAAQPKQALHRARLARAYLSASLGEMARAEAQKAVALDPQSPVAYDTLGWVLENDLVGRPYKRGFDCSGAQAAYRKAKQLDPKDPHYAFAYGESLEYSADGQRYSERAALDEAASVYRELRKNKDADQDAVNEHLLYVLAYAHRFAELRDLLAELGNKPLYNSMRLVATAGLEGGAAAVRRAAEITADEKAKSDALANSGTLMMRTRLYAEAAEMLAAAAPGQSNASQMGNLAQLLRTLRKRETLTWNDAEPGLFVLHALSMAADPDKRPELVKIMSRAVQELPGDAALDTVKRYWSLKFTTDLPQTVMADFTLALAKTSAEGDDATGYRVKLQTGVASTQNIYVVKEDGKLKLLAESANYAPLGREVLDRIDRNDLKGAKALLDWTREDLKLVGGEDPYAGPAFARLWNKNHAADAVAMRVAAVPLLTSAHGAAQPYIASLEAARAAAASDAERAKIDEALVWAYNNTKNWPGMERSAANLLAGSESAAMFQLLAGALESQSKWPELAALIEQHKGKLSDDITALNVEANSYTFRGQPAKAVELFKALIDSGKGGASVVNSYGWAGVMAGDVTPEMLQTMQQTINQPKNQMYGILHTVGCMYAIANRPAQAQQILWEAMKLDGSTDEPESSIWYGFGLLAERFGELEAAAKLYALVDKPKYYDPDPPSTYALAQGRLTTLHKPGTATGK